VGTPAFWIPPEDIASPSFLGICGSCHDNGAIIRSPYLNQMKSKPHALPGFDDETFNSDQRYYFVGSLFGAWKAYKVEVAGNICNECHRMGVNNLAKGSLQNRGTARDFGIRATDRDQTSKNPHSADSPIWMIASQQSLCPDQTKLFCQANFDAARAIKDCADQFSEGSPLPNAPACKITQFTGPASAPTLKLGGQLTNDPAVAANADGRLEIFARGTDNALWHIWDSDLGWSRWESLGGFLAGNVAVGRNADGRLEVFALSDLDNSLWHNWQTSAGGDWSGWKSLGGVLVGKFAVGTNADGRLEVFVRGTDNALWHNWQTSPNGGWSGWRPLGGVFVGDPTVEVNGDGRLEAFVQATDKSLWHKWQITPNGDWSGWSPLGGVLAGNIAVGRNADNGLEVYVQGTDNGLWRNLQSGSQWSGWQALGGQVTHNLVLGRNADGWLQVFVRGDDNELSHNWLVPGWN
jgi:hypothetical protein